VEAQAITLAPGAPVPRHTHPCAVVGVVLDGTIRYAREGAPEQLLRPGDAFHEPAHVLVHHFDNASADAPATFVAFYLVEKDGPTIELVG
jgi:quercetin dioxygenase-like cupin family protein